MNNIINNQYLQNKQNRKRNTCHWRLAINQTSQYPILLILVIPIIFLTILIWSKMDFVIAVFEVPKIILPAYTIILKSFGVLMPILLVCGLIDIIGTLTARKDEATIQMAFMERELRNGSPILMYKRKNKKTGVTVRVWYSSIPMKVWLERQDEIADALNIHFTEKFRYGGNGDSNRIVMCSAKGREVLKKESLVYDKDLEKDMEIIE